jgi:hypothetical protein
MLEAVLGTDAKVLTDLIDSFKMKSVDESQTVKQVSDTPPQDGKPAVEKARADTLAMAPPSATFADLIRIGELQDNVPGFLTLSTKEDMNLLNAKITKEKAPLADLVASCRSAKNDLLKAIKDAQGDASKDTSKKGTKAKAAASAPAKSGARLFEFCPTFGTQIATKTLVEGKVVDFVVNEPFVVPAIATACQLKAFEGAEVTGFLTNFHKEWMKCEQRKNPDGPSQGRAVQKMPKGMDSFEQASKAFASILPESGQGSLRTVTDEKVNALCIPSGFGFVADKMDISAEKDSVACIRCCLCFLLCFVNVSINWLCKQDSPSAS